MLYIGRKVRQIMGRENGQSMVEMALLMCFAVAVFLAINWDGIRDSAGGAYLKMASSMGTKPSPTEMVEGSTETYAEKEARYKRMSTEELRQTDNAERIDMDRANIAALGEFLLTLNKSQIKSLFPGVTDARLTGNDSKPGVGLFDYCIGNTGDNGEALKIILRINGDGYLSNQQAIQWMQGNFDINTDNYPKPQKDEEVSKRFFYSDAAIDPAPVSNISADLVQSATLWASFSFDSAGNVTSVKLDMTRNHEIAKNKWSPDRTYCEGLSDIIVSR